MRKDRFPSDLNMTIVVVNNIPRPISMMLVRVNWGGFEEKPLNLQCLQLGLLVNITDTIIIIDEFWQLEQNSFSLNHRYVGLMTTFTPTFDADHKFV